MILLYGERGREKEKGGKWFDDRKTGREKSKKGERSKHSRRPDSATGYDKIISRTQPPRGIGDLVHVVWNDLDPTEVDPEIEAVLGEEIGVGVQCLPGNFQNVSQSI